MNMTENELEPWVVVLGSDRSVDAELNSYEADPIASEQLAMWRLSQTGQPALAFFSSAPLAEAYAMRTVEENWQIARPTRTALLAILIGYFQQAVEYAVLDPDDTSARQIFTLRDVLKAARTHLVSRREPL